MRDIIPTCPQISPAIVHCKLKYDIMRMTYTMAKIHETATQTYIFLIPFHLRDRHLSVTIANHMAADEIELLHIKKLECRGTLG